MSNNEVITGKLRKPPLLIKPSCRYPNSPYLTLFIVKVGRNWTFIINTNISLRLCSGSVKFISHWIFPWLFAEKQNFPFLHDTTFSQSNPIINNITNGPQKSGHIENIASKLFLNKENGWVFSQKVTITTTWSHYWAVIRKFYKMTTNLNISSWWIDLDFAKICRARVTTCNWTCYLLSLSHHYYCNLSTTIQTTSWHKSCAQVKILKTRIKQTEKDELHSAFPISLNSWWTCHTLGFI